MLFYTHDFQQIRIAYNNYYLKSGRKARMSFLDWAALIIGAGLIGSGVRAIRRRQANVPEQYEGERAIRLGRLWIGLGALFILSVIFDIAFLKTLFRLFLDAAN
jgi:hypothetical protein